MWIFFILLLPCCLTHMTCIRLRGGDRIFDQGSISSTADIDLRTRSAPVDGTTSIIGWVQDAYRQEQQEVGADTHVAHDQAGGVWTDWSSRGRRRGRRRLASMLHQVVDETRGLDRIEDIPDHAVQDGKSIGCAVQRLCAMIEMPDVMRAPVSHSSAIQATSVPSEISCSRVAASAARS